jgi:hypothetical protein
MPGDPEVLSRLTVEGREFDYFDVTQFGQAYFELPFCLRIWYESVVRNAYLQHDEDVKKVWKKVAEALLENPRETEKREQAEVLFQPGEHNQ